MELMAREPTTTEAAVDEAAVTLASTEAALELTTTVAAVELASTRATQPEIGTVRWSRGGCAAG